MKVRPHKKYEGVFLVGHKLATKNLISGKSIGEELFGDYRIWDPTRSKPAAAMLNGIKTFPIKSGNRVLYLGCGSGTSASYLSDIVGLKGVIYSVDIALRVMRDFVFLSNKRKNLIPILSDSRRPEQYSSLVESVEVIYEDVAQRDQAEILVKNAEMFLKRNGFALLMVKSRSINAVERPRKVYSFVMDKLRKGGFNIVDIKRLEPYEKDHAAILCKWKK